MKFKLKKIVALLVTSFIGVTSICPAFAAEPETASSVLVETEDCSNAKAEFMEEIDIVVTLMEINLGRDNIDMANATIGQPFLVANSDIYIFPVLVDGNIERLIQMTKGDNGDNYFAISEFFADGIDNLADDTYKIVADENFDVFAINDEESVLINKNTDDEESIVEPVMTLSDEDLDVVDVKDIFVDLGSIPMPAADAKGDGYWLGVPAIKQTTNTCWAACMASILKHHGENISLNDILNRTNMQNKTADYDKVKSYFKNYYGYSSEYFGGGKGKLSFSSIMSEINAGRPIWQAIGFADGTGGHAVVIEGYQKKGTGKSNAISIMDPYVPKIVDCNYSSSNDFEYSGRQNHEGLYKIRK